MERSPVTTPFTVSAPGRVNLIGEHVDYNDGFVLPMAIERHVHLRVLPRADRLIVLRTRREPGETTLDLATPLVPRPGHWSTYVAGVIEGFRRQGFDPPGFEAEVTATLPAGGGLSSSAALEVATATALETLVGRELGGERKALLCQAAEHEFAGVPCGIMDQFAVTLARPGHALLLDCRSRAVTHVPLADPSVAVAVIDSGVKHDLAAGAYARRRDECRRAADRLGVASLRDLSADEWRSRGPGLPEIERKRVAHVVSENARVQAFAASIDLGDFVRAGRIMVESHWSLARDYEVSCPEMDALVAAANRVPGVLGCRMTGGGFGGCAVALVRADTAAATIERIVDGYRTSTGNRARGFVTAPCGGPEVAPAAAAG
ncbi:MAG: galactokinase [Planctomycetia bacterium]